MSRHRGLRLVVVSVAAISACSTPAPASNAGNEVLAGFNTSQPQYEASWVGDHIEVDIPYVYRNASTDSVYFINCNGIIVPALERLTGETWSSVWLGATPACLSAPVIVPPEGEYSDTVHVRSDPDVHPLLDIANVAGTYRLVWHGVVHSYDTDTPQFGVPLEQDDRTSNEFELTAPRQ